jgi:hypothetical protein
MVSQAGETTKRVRAGSSGPNTMVTLMHRSGLLFGRHRMSGNDTSRRPA